MKKIITLKNWWKTQKRITIKEVVLRYFIILLAGVVAYYSKTETKEWINTVAFGIGLIMTFYLKKHFFPFMTFYLLFFFSASANELLDGNSRNQPFTTFLWDAGNILLPIAIITFAIQLIFTYKIVDRDD